MTDEENPRKGPEQDDEVESRPARPDEQRMRRSHTRSAQTYALFLNELCRIGRMSPDFAERAAVSVLCALEQRLTADEANDMEAQLPMRLQNLLVRCSRHREPVPPKFGREEFLKMVAGDLGMQPEEIEGVVRSVFATVREWISEGEVDEVIQQLPREFEDLWQRPI